MLLSFLLYLSSLELLLIEELIYGKTRIPFRVCKKTLFFHWRRFLLMSVGRLRGNQSPNLPKVVFPLTSPKFGKGYCIKKSGGSGYIDQHYSPLFKLILKKCEKSYDNCSVSYVMENILFLYTISLYKNNKIFIWPRFC